MGYSVLGFQEMDINQKPSIYVCRLMKFICIYIFCHYMYNMANKSFTDKICVEHHLEIVILQLHQFYFIPLRNLQWRIRKVHKNYLLGIQLQGPHGEYIGTSASKPGYWLQRLYTQYFHCTTQHTDSR